MKHAWFATMAIWGCSTGVEEPIEPNLFAFPLAEPAMFYQTTGFDHDPESHDDTVLGAAICQDYIGRAFPWCYDGHDGSDYLMEGGFPTMDAGSVQILAAADGEVEWTRDGEYDRCHAVIDGSIDCDGHPIVANGVKIRHSAHTVTSYWHLKSGSVAVEVGDRVLTGDVLGLVGSSGISSMPHLHFEITDEFGAATDPYVDPAGSEPSRWCDQGDPEGLPGACQTR